MKLPRWYARLFARLLHGATPAMDRVYADDKRRLFRGLQGAVLDVGTGAGANLRWLPRDAAVLAIDPSRHMLPYARRRLRDRRHVLVQAQGEQLPLRADSVDAALCACVLCSVDDPAAVLAELRRVLKRGGRVVFIEHVAAPPGSWLRRTQNLAAPLWKLAAGGCHPNRDTVGLLRSAGFNTLQLEKRRLPGLFLASPHVFGYAEK
jgi:SAM-dependent methyltransferase